MSIMESDALAQYELGKILQKKARVTEKEEIEEGKKYNLSTITLFRASRIYEKAFYQFQEARFENADAAYEYAASLELGNGTEPNLEEAHHWYQTAAFRGSVDAKAVYGTLCLQGSDVIEKNLSEALTFLEEAAEAEHPMALTNLGAIYAQGEEVTQELKKSFEYTLKAANAGYPMARYNLASMYLNGNGIDQDEELAFEYLNMASEQELWKAKIALAQLYLLGQGCERDLKKAEELFQFYETPDEMLLLSAHYVSGAFGVVDNYKAAALLQKAYEFSEEGTEANKLAYERSPMIVQKLRMELKSNTLDKDQWDNSFVVSSLFDEKGYPYKNSKECVSLLAKKIFQISEKRKNSQSIEAGILDISPSRPRSARQPERATKQPGRNDPCPCGSGEKYKKCCGKNNS